MAPPLRPPPPPPPPHPHGPALALRAELNFVLIGVMLQLASVVTESTRLTLVQILLQRRGVKLNPITTLYLIAPCCFAFLCVPFVSEP